MENPSNQTNPTSSTSEPQAKAPLSFFRPVKPSIISSRELGFFALGAAVGAGLYALFRH